MDKPSVSEMRIGDGGGCLPRFTLPRNGSAGLSGAVSEGGRRTFARTCACTLFEVRARAVHGFDMRS